MVGCGLTNQQRAGTKAVIRVNEQDLSPTGGRAGRRRSSRRTSFVRDHEGQHFRRAADPILEGLPLVGASKMASAVMDQGRECKPPGEGRPPAGSPRTGCLGLEECREAPIKGAT